MNVKLNTEHKINISWRTNRHEKLLDANFCAHKIGRPRFEAATIYIIHERDKNERNEKQC